MVGNLMIPFSKGLIIPVSEILLTALVNTAVALLILAHPHRKLHLEPLFGKLVENALGENLHNIASMKQYQNPNTRIMILFSICKDSIQSTNKTHCNEFDPRLRFKFGCLRNYLHP